MTINLPRKYEDITIKQIMQVGDKELNDIELVRVFAGLTHGQVNELPYAMIEKGAEHINEILQQPTSKHFKKIKVGGVDHGFIPDWSELKTKEYVDLTTYCADAITNADKVLSILYRPITRDIGEKYDIEDYNGTKNLEAYQELSASYLYGALVFFSTILEDYKASLAQSLIQATLETKKQIERPAERLLASVGHGIISSLNWLKEMCLKLINWLNYLLHKS